MSVSKNMMWTNIMRRPTGEASVMRLNSKIVRVNASLVLLTVTNAINMVSATNVLTITILKMTRKSFHCPTVLPAMLAANALKML